MSESEANANAVRQPGLASRFNHADASRAASELNWLHVANHPEINAYTEVKSAAASTAADLDVARRACASRHAIKLLTDAIRSSGLPVRVDRISAASDRSGSAAAEPLPQSVHAATHMLEELAQRNSVVEYVFSDVLRKPTETVLVSVVDGLRILAVNVTTPQLELVRDQPLLVLRALPSRTVR